MAYEITGKIAAIYPVVQRTESFKTREFVIEKTEDIGSRTVTNYIKFQCVQDRTTILDRMKVGEEVKVHFNLKGSKWVKDGRENFITNLDAWRIEQFVPSAQAGADPMPPASAYTDMPATDPVDDLPF
ncbi:MAG: DUF3127 domain-containing protein [Chitinophagaceae bacterium]|jgi:hypothetical protein|nr:DUF3127 domain-containing protein [Chitinophagaceae bacterium]